MDLSRLDHQMLETCFGNEVAQSIASGTLAKKGTDELPYELGVARPDPNAVMVAALLMVSNAIGSTNTFDEMMTPGHFLIVEPPSNEWLAPVVTAFMQLLKNQGPVSSRAPTDQYDRATSYVLSDIFSPGTFEIARKQHSVELNDVDVIAALASQKPVIAVGTVDAAFQTPRIRANADKILTVVPPDDRIVRNLSELYCTEPFSDTNLPPGIAPTDLALAFRRTGPSQRALDVLEACQRERAEPITPHPERGLEDIHGLDPLRSWAELLSADIALVRAGTLPASELPRGVLVCGPPGIGKTKAAAAIARYCDVALVEASAATWLGEDKGHLGSLLIAMRKSFARAAKHAPCIMLIDELDSFPYRGADGHFWDTALAGLLEALDGTRAVEGLIVMGLCNNRSRLDPALMRAGRFDHILDLARPQVGELAQMFRSCLKPDLQEHDFVSLASEVIGATIADVDRICRDARRRSRLNERSVSLDDVRAVIADTERKQSPEATARVATHEIGHAILAHINRVPLRSVTLHRAGYNGDGLGQVEAAFHTEVPTLARILQLVEVLLAGQAAEFLVFGAVSIGGAQDLERASRLLFQALALEGMGKSLLWYSEARFERGLIPTALSAEIEGHLQQCRTSAELKLLEQLPALHRLKALLLSKNFLDGSVVASEINAAESGLDHELLH